MSLDIMIDLETLGTTADAVIISMGAVTFNLDACVVFDELKSDSFYTAVNIDSQSNRHTSGATLQWWDQQSLAAHRVFAEAADGPPLVDALAALSVFIAKCNWDKVVVWSNGADFDLPMLAHAYSQYGVALPWKPYAGRCYRTYKNLPGARAIAMQRQGLHHNALDDAIDQARHLCAIHAALFSKSSHGPETAFGTIAQGGAA